MATRQYIATCLRRLSPDFADETDDDLFDIANTCSCGRPGLFTPDEIDAFVARSETANDFLRHCFLTLPKPNSCEEE